MWVYYNPCLSKYDILPYLRNQVVADNNQNSYRSLLHDMEQTQITLHLINVLVLILQFQNIIFTIVISII